jgi:hypothetical protein
VSFWYSTLKICSDIHFCDPQGLGHFWTGHPLGMKAVQAPRRDLALSLRSGASKGAFATRDSSFGESWIGYKRRRGLEHEDQHRPAAAVASFQSLITQAACVEVERPVSVTKLKGLSGPETAWAKRGCHDPCRSTRCDCAVHASKKHRDNHERAVARRSRRRNSSANAVIR